MISKSRSGGVPGVFACEKAVSAYHKTGLRWPDALPHACFRRSIVRKWLLQPDELLAEFMVDDTSEQDVQKIKSLSESAKKG